MYVLHKTYPIGTYTLWDIKQETQRQVVAKGKCLISHRYGIGHDLCNLSPFPSNSEGFLSNVYLS